MAFNQDLQNELCTKLVELSNIKMYFEFSDLNKLSYSKHFTEHELIFNLQMLSDRNMIVPFNDIDGKPLLQSHGKINFHINNRYRITRDMVAHHISAKNSGQY